MADLIRVRATINFNGLRCGQIALVDPDDPYMRDNLAAMNLVRVGDEPPAAEEGDTHEAPQGEPEAENEPAEAPEPIEE